MRSYIYLYILLLSAVFIIGCPLADTSFDHPQTLDHNKKYEDIPFLYNQNTYCGRESGGSGAISHGTSSMSITQPAVTHFRADGFFTLKGTINKPAVYHYALVRVKKDGTDLQSSYFPRKNFEHRIWLPFGAGLYTIEIFDIAHIDINLLGEGNIKSISRLRNPSYTFSVENTRDENGCFLYPSYFIQSDNPLIMKKAALLTEGVSNNEEKIRRIHDAVCETIRYDIDSLRPDSYKKQDAISVFNSQLAVCEGYTSLTAALLRAAGIKAKAVVGSGLPAGAAHAGPHAWLHVESEKNGSKKYRLLDPTWDDGETADPNGHFIKEGTPRYIYFLLDLETNEGNHRHSHRQGKDETGNSFPGEDGKYEGTRPGRSILF